MPVKKTAKKIKRPAVKTRAAKPAPTAKLPRRAKPAKLAKRQPLIAAKPKKYPAKYVVLGLFLFIFVSWLAVAIFSVNNLPTAASATYLNRAAVDPACNNDPLVTVPNCSQIKRP